jgi:ribosomal protein S18 acetylase RimI-like enzyme
LVFETLSEDKKHFIVPRPSKELEQRLKISQDSDTPTVGIFYKERTLVATAAAVFPTQEKLEKYERVCALSINATRLAIIETVLVHPDYIGQGLGKTVLQELIGHSKERGRDLLVAEIAQENTPSTKAFERHGFVVEGSYISPEDNCKVIMVANEGYMNAVQNGVGITDVDHLPKQMAASIPVHKNLIKRVYG